MTEKMTKQMNKYKTFQPKETMRRNVKDNYYLLGITKRKLSNLIRLSSLENNLNVLLLGPQ